MEHEIQVRDDNGRTQGVFKDIESCTLDQSCNNPAVLSLTCPLSAQTSTLLQYLQRPNEIWAFRDGVALFSGPINLRDDVHKGGIVIMRLIPLLLFMSTRRQGSMSV